jgi:predicted nucleic acid-binding protein
MSTSDNRALIDTNVLVYAADTSSSFQEPSRQLRDRGFRGEIPFVVTPQVLMEFFAVITTVIQQNNPGFQALRYKGVNRMNPEGLNDGDDYQYHDHTR